MRQHIIDLGTALLEEHGLDEDGWIVRAGSARRRFGSCNFSTRTITVSAPLAEVNSIEEVRDTLLHEIAHALVGFSHHHDHVWKAKCREIGARPEARASGAVTLPRRWVGTCPNCGYQSRKDRRTRVACGACCKVHNGGQFTSEFLLVWERNQSEASSAA